MTVARPNGFTAYGVDGCRDGWLVVALQPSGRADWFVTTSLADVVAVGGESDRVFVDIPIGLRRDAHERKCDVVARATLKAPRASSVFRAPVREVFVAESYEQAGDISAETTGKRLARQTWSIVPKITEVDTLLRHCPKARSIVREVHPEVCFWGLAGKAMRNGKKTAGGFEERLAVLTRFWPSVGEFVDRVLRATKRKAVARDDILDAVVAALVAAQPECGLRCLPRQPETDEFGLRMEMVFTRGNHEDGSDEGATNRSTLSNALVVERVGLAKDLGRCIHECVGGWRLPGEDRCRVGVALLQHCEDVADATIVLLESGLPGPALALARSLFESYVRGVWTLHCADDEAVAEFIESGRPTPWQLAKLINALKEKVPDVGEWTTAQARQLPALHDLAHGGRLHVLGHNTSKTIEPRYDGRDLVTLVDLGIELRIRVGVELLTLLDDERAMEELMEMAGRFDRRPVDGGG